MRESIQETEETIFQVQLGLDWYNKEHIFF